MIPYISAIVGVLLCTLTAAGLIGSRSNSTEAAFLPMLIGVPLFVGGIVGLNPRRRRLALRFSGWIAIAGAAIALATVIYAGRWELVGTKQYSLTKDVALGMGLLCFSFVAVWLLSRRRRHSMR